MTNSHLKLACILLRIQNSHQKPRFKLSSLSSPSSKIYSMRPTIQDLSQIPLVVSLQMEAGEQKMIPKNKLCFMLENLIFLLIMRGWEHVCRECNGGWWNWRKPVGKCKSRWQKSWSQKPPAIAMPYPCPSSVHDGNFARPFRFFFSYYMYRMRNWFVFVIVFLLFYKIKVGSEPFLQQRFHVLAVQIQRKKTMCSFIWKASLYSLCCLCPFFVALIWGQICNAS